MSVINKYLVLLLCLSNLHAWADVSEFKRDLQRFTTTNSVGYSVLISQNQKIVYQDAAGLANLELSVPMQAHHIFETGSLTKQFTAVAILKLVQDGHLSLSDPINKYIEGINSTKGQVTLRHLLQHTSGLVDPINEPEFLATRVQEPVTLDELIGQFKNGAWQFNPGDRTQYSNVGYSMLAKVIEIVSGGSYQEYLKQTLFQPLGMGSTSQASMAITLGKVTGYSFDGDQPRQNDLLNLAWGYGAADLLSNTRDLSKFRHALMNGEILDKKHLASFLAPIRLNDGTEIPGSFTYSLVTIAGKQAIRMSGSTLGYSCHSIYFPTSDTYIVVLGNSDGVNGGAWIPPATIASKLAATLLHLPIPDYQEVAIAEAMTKGYLGQYQLENGDIRSLDFKDGRFYYQRNQGQQFEVIPMSGNRFYFPDTLSYSEIGKPGQEDRNMLFYYFLSDTPETALLTPSTSLD